MDFFEILQQGADDANKKPEPPLDPKAAAKEEKRRAKEAAREAKEAERAEREAAREAAREEKRQAREEREVHDEEFADEAETQGYVSPPESEIDGRSALAALLAAGPEEDAIAPNIAAAAAPAPEPAPAVSDPPAAPVPPVPPIPPAPPVPPAPAAAPVPPVPPAPPASPADIPNEPVDPARNYEWTAPLPAATQNIDTAAGPGFAAAGAAGAAAAGTGAAAFAASRNLASTEPISTAAETEASRASQATKPPKPPRDDDDSRKQKVLAWVVVAIVAIIALIVALIFVLPAINGDRPAPNPEPTPTEPTPAPEPEPTPEPTPTPSDDAPVIDPGATSPMDIQTWGITVDVSTKFGRTAYQITGNTLLIDNAIIQSFPESCAELRTGWGITKATPPARNGVVVSGSAYNIAKPEGTCSANPSLYNEVWGLTQAMVNSAKALP